MGVVDEEAERRGQGCWGSGGEVGDDQEVMVTWSEVRGAGCGFRWDPLGQRERNEEVQVGCLGV